MPVPRPTSEPSLPSGEIRFRIHRSPDYETMSGAVAAHLAGTLRRKPDALMILAAGSTPERAYQRLVALHRDEPELCDQMRVAKLDEWGGLELEDPASCEAYLRRTVIDPLGIAPQRYLSWQSRPASVDQECARIRDWLAAQGSADVCLLGLGLNGHLGFNEPGSSLPVGPHRAELAGESMQHPMLTVANQRPEYGLTLSLREILASREIMLLVSGGRKKRQLQRLLKPVISTKFPASFLWLHPAVSIFCDAAALPEAV
jgi:galactosamine-6-phosphate isomerase